MTLFFTVLDKVIVFNFSFHYYYMAPKINPKFGPPKRDYSKKKKVDKVISQLVLHGLESIDKNKNVITDLHKRYLIPVSTLYSWNRRLTFNPSWRPYNNRINHGTHNRIFTDKEEQSLANYIKENIINQHYHFTDRNFIYLANQAFQDKYRNIETKKEFKISHHFIQDFKKRNRISTRKAHFKRKDNVDPKDYKDFISEIKELIKQADTRDDIVLVNADETAWYILPQNVHTWATTGSENVIILTKDEEKANFTCMCSITSNYQALKLFLILDNKKVTNDEFENIENDSYPHSVNMSNSQWMTQKLFCEYLKFLRDQISADKTIHLLIDNAPSHKGQIIEDKAEELNIILHYIPPGCTDELQPLDIRIFGCLKSISGNKTLQEIHLNQLKPVGFSKAVKILIKSWNDVSIMARMEAWAVYED